MINQLTKSMLHISITIDIGFNCINDTVVCNTTFNNIKARTEIQVFPANAYQRLLHNDI